MAGTEEHKDLNKLGRAWSERIKGIRRIVKGGSSGSDAMASTAASLDNDLFAGEVDEKCFSDDSAGQSSPAVNSTDLSQNHAVISNGQKYASLLPKLIIGVGIVLLLVLVSYGLLNNPLKSRAAASDSVNPDAVNNVISKQDEPVAIRQADTLLDDDQPISLKIAQTYYQYGQYAHASAVYGKMLEANAGNEGLKEFLQLSMMVCADQTDLLCSSDDTYPKLLKSCFSTIRVMANYYLCLKELRQRQFLSARQRAYQAIALVDAVETKSDVLQFLRRDLYFLAAQATTCQALMLSDSDKDLPLAFWPVLESKDIIANIDDRTLRSMIQSESQKFQEAALGPVLELDDIDTIRYCRVICNRASFDELMGRFTINTGYDIRWDMNSGQASVRNKSLSMYIREMTDEQFATIAAGCAGFVSSIEDQCIVIRDPKAFLHLSEQISCMHSEAVLSWHRFIFKYPDDPLLANAHFVLGILRADQNQLLEALSEYKVVANRYYQSELAANALVNSANLKRKLNDHAGAYKDLLDVVQQYPDCRAIDRAYMSLGQVAETLGKHEEAAGIYSKLYHLNYSPEVQAAAALSAGQIYYQLQDYQNAEKWLSRYVEVEMDTEKQDYAQACLFLGETWMGLDKDEMACDALQKSLAGKLSQEEYIQAVTSLVRSYTERGLYVHALSILNETNSRQFAREGSIRMLLLRSQTLRQMGLTENAVAILRDREEYLVDNVLKAEVAYEISECYMEQQKYELAYKKLIKVLQWIDAGPVVHKSLLLMARASLKQGLEDEAMDICMELLDLGPEESLKQQTLGILAKIYGNQNNYDRAALALMGQWQ